MALGWLQNLGLAGGSGVVAAPTVSTTRLDDATINERYSATLTATGGTTPFTWSLFSGTLPVGLNLSAAGGIAGIPLQAETRSFTVQVSDANGKTDTQALTLTVTPNFFGVWERVPIAQDIRIPGDMTANASQVSLEVEEPEIILSGVTETIGHVSLKAASAKSLGRVTSTVDLEPVLRKLTLTVGEVGVMEDSELEDIQALLLAGVLTAEEGLSLQLDYMRRNA